MQNVDDIFDKWKSRWVSSVLEVFILFTISIKERYGGELVNLSKIYVDKGTKVPTVYAIIKRYTKSGIFEELRIETKSSITRGKSRIYYKLTKEGNELIKMIEQHFKAKYFIQTLDFSQLEVISK